MQQRGSERSWGNDMARVLVIDDDSLLVQVITRTLETRGYEVASATDGEAGMRMFQQSSYDVVLCDLVMPRQEGLQTIQQLRGSSPNVAIVAISGGLSMGAAASIDILEIAGKFGADVTLRKPFQMSTVAEAIESAMARHRPGAVAARA